jgi:hypothetical protein
MMSVVDGKFVVEDVCKLCALVKNRFSFERYCTDCWERMSNAR